MSDDVIKNDDLPDAVLFDEEFAQALSESGKPAGVALDDSEDFVEPFDPDLIAIEQKGVPMDTLIRRLKQGSIRLSPNFQRKEVWDSVRRSRLIESIILRIPLPMFYVAADADGRWDVVDGLQRLSTIRNFVLGNEKKEKLRLEGLEFLGDRLNGKSFDDMDNDANIPVYQRMINTIMETEMRFTVINPGTPEEVKRNVFKRLNTGGLPLTLQEIRHALYQGQATDLLITLADSDLFKKATDYSIDDSRMAARELILYFLAFAIFPRTAYKGNVDTWLSNALRVINLMPNLEQAKLVKIFGSQENIPDIQIKSIEDLTARFELAMQRGLDLFGKHAFRKSLPINNERRTPVNKALFETWGNILSLLNELNLKYFLENKEVFFKLLTVIMNGSESLRDSLRPTYDHASYSELDEEKQYLYYEELKMLVIAMFGNNIKDMSINNFQSIRELTYTYFTFIAGQFDDELADDESLIQDLHYVLDGRMGESLNLAISRNASEIDSVNRRFNYLNNLVNNMIAYHKQEQAA